MWFLLFWVFIFIIMGFLGDEATEVVDNTSTTNIQYEGNLDVNGKTNSISSDDTISITTSEEAVKDNYFAYAILCGLITTGAFFTITDSNKAQQLKAKIPSLEADVLTLEERREHQISQANRVLDKFLNQEYNIQTSVASSRVKSGLEFQAMIEKYPDLTSNQATITLLNQIKDVESLLSNQKQLLHSTVAQYNGLINSFPLSLFKRIAKLENAQIDYTSNLQDEVSDDELGI